ncbi:MAG: hypothetical protein HY645_11800 [Acidobacteria bacterium]|nr:hypothetical protein [Acidobacteriota bacterium]
MTSKSFEELQGAIKTECQRKAITGVQFPAESAINDMRRLADAPRGGGHFTIDFRSEDGQVILGFRTADRYLNESIEQHILHVADGSMEEFLEEGLDRVGLEGRFGVDHYRDQKEFCFTTTLAPGSHEIICDLLRAYLAAFEPLVG